MGVVECVGLMDSVAIRSQMELCSCSFFAVAAVQPNTCSKHVIM